MPKGWDPSTKIEERNAPVESGRTRFLGTVADTFERSTVLLRLGKPDSEVLLTLIEQVRGDTPLDSISL